MSVRKRGQSWQVDVKVGRERVRQDIRGTKQDAQREEAKIRQKLLSERTPDRGLEEALLKYLEEYVPHLTDQDGQKNKAKHLRPLLVGKTFKHVPDVVKDLKNLPLQPATINRRLALLRRFCNLAWKEWGWLDKPVNVTLLPEKNQRHIYLSREQVESICQYCRPAVADLIRLAAYTGFRRSELLRLGKENVIDGCLVLEAGAKTGRPRIVPIHDDIKELTEKLPLAVTDQIVRDDWEIARSKAGLSNVHFHDLRHTWASWLAQSGVPLYTIGEILGHSQTQTTKRYSHLGRDDLKAAIRLVKP